MQEQNKRASMAEAQVATLKQAGPGRYCPPRHRMPCKSRNQSGQTHFDDVVGDGSGIYCSPRVFKTRVNMANCAKPLRHLV